MGVGCIAQAAFSLSGNFSALSEYEDCNAAAAALDLLGMGPGAVYFDQVEGVFQRGWVAVIVVVPSDGFEHETV